VTGRAKPKAATPASSPAVVIVMDVMEPKKHSVRFLTEEEGAAVGNLYLNNKGHAALGRPGKIKVTIEPAE
jgi:hypothetical protein